MSQLVNAEVNRRVTVKPRGDDGDDQMGAKIKKTQKSTGLPRKPKKSLDQNLTPEKIPCRISEP